MPFTIEDFGDLVKLLGQHPEWQAELRRHVLSEELLELPALVRQLAEAQGTREGVRTTRRSTSWRRSRPPWTPTTSNDLPIGLQSLRSGVGPSRPWSQAVASTVTATAWGEPVCAGGEPVLRQAQDELA